MKTRIQYYFIVLLFFGCTSKDSETIGKDSETIGRHSQKDKPHIKDKSELIGNWILTSGFTDKKLTFLKENYIDTNEQWLKQFTFKPNELTFNYLKTFPRCGNGLVSIDSCFWKIKDDKIELFLAGHEIEYKFINHGLYHQKPALKNEIVLIRDSVIQSEYKQLNVFKFE
jgi:hypothetical protein